jgi:carbamoylphosphate synthase large subunit
MSHVRLVLGNKPDWTLHMVPKLGNNFRLADDLLKDSHAGWADVVVPLALNDYDILRANPLFIDKVLLPSAAAVDICHDKQLFREWFLSRFDHAYLPSQTGKSQFSIAKRRRGEWGQGSFLIAANDRAAREAVRSDYTMLLEDYVAGNREFAFHLLVDRGRVLYSARSSHDHDLSFYVRGEGYQRAQTIVEQCEEIPKIFLDLLAELDYSGAACIDYKLDETGQIRIFEVNPRMGGSLMRLAGSFVAAYVDYILMRRGSAATV